MRRMRLRRLSAVFVFVSRKLHTPESVEGLRSAKPGACWAKAKGACYCLRNDIGRDSCGCTQGCMSSMIDVCESDDSSQPLAAGSATAVI